MGRRKYLYLPHQNQSINRLESVRLSQFPGAGAEAETSKGIMAAFLFLVQLLFIGTLIVPAYTQTERCDWLLNATASNFTVSTSPTAYQANTTYLGKPPLSTSQAFHTAQKCISSAPNPAGFLTLVVFLDMFKTCEV